MKQWKNNHSLQLCTTRCVISSRQRRSVHAERCSVSLEPQDAERSRRTCFPGLSAVLHFVPSIDIRLAWKTETYHESNPGTLGFMHFLFNTRDTNPVLFPIALVPHWQNAELELQRLLCSSLTVLRVFPNLCNCSKLLVTELRVGFFLDKNPHMHHVRYFSFTEMLSSAWAGVATDPGNNSRCGVWSGICICAKHCNLQEHSSAELNSEFSNWLGGNKAAINYVLEH